MLRASAMTLAAFLLLGTLLTAQEGSSKRPLGTWTRSTGDTTIVFEITPHALRVLFTEGGNKATVDADYAVSKDGVLFGRISKVTPEADQGPKVGQLFSFRYAVKDGTMTLSELNSSGGEHARKLFEGDYKGGATKKTD